VLDYGAGKIVGRKAIAEMVADPEPKLHAPRQ
jgi:hypothetical protein